MGALKRVASFFEKVQNVKIRVFAVALFYFVNSGSSQLSISITQLKCIFRVIFFKRYFEL